MSGGLVIAWPAWTKSASTPGPLAARALASCPKHLGGFDGAAEADDAIPSIRASATQIVSVSRFRRNHPLRLADDRTYPLMTQGCSTSLLYRGFRGHTPPCPANARRRAGGRLGHYRATSTAASGRPFSWNMAMCRRLARADDGSRTRDLRLGKPTLYQLSYVRVERGILVRAYP